MRPDFSVRHSPRLTNRKGTPTRGSRRRQCRRTRRSTVERHADLVRSIAACAGAGPPAGAAGFRKLAKKAPSPAAQGFAGQDQHEGKALQHQHRRIGQAQAALQQAAGGAEAAEQDGHRNDGQRVVPRDERHQDAGVAVARDQRGVGAVVHRRHLDGAGQARRRRRPGRRPAGSGAWPAGPPAARRAGCRRPRAAAKPPGVQRSHRPRPTQATTPRTRPQCTSEPAMPPMRRPSARAAVDGLFRLAGSRSGPSTKCLNSAIAM